MDTHFWDVALSCSVPFVLEIGLFHLQLFLNSYVHFCVTGVGELPSVGSLAQKEFLHLCCIHFLPCAGPPGAVFIVDVHLTMFRLSAPFSDKLHPLYLSIT